MILSKSIKLSLLIILVVFTNTTFSSSWFLVDKTNETELNSATEKTETIKELKEEVKTIKEKKQETNKQFDILKRKVLISDFFRGNLNEEEKIKLNKLVLEYKRTKEKLNRTLRIKSKNLQDTKKTIKNLLQNEKEIYIKLLPFIKTNKYEWYKAFIKKDLEMINKNSNLESNLVKKETIIKNKIEILKEKIEEHNELLSKKLKDLVNKKIDWKLNELISKEKFKNLSYESKIKLFNKLIDNINSKKEKLEKQNNKTRLLIKKIELYKIIVERIELFRDKI